MPFAVPGISDLIAAAEADINTRLPGGDARLGRNLLGVLARVEAGAVAGLYGYLGWIAQQIIPDSAEAAYLDRWSSLFGVVREAPQPASGQVAFTGDPTASPVVPAGTLLGRSDGVQFALAADTPLAGGAGAGLVVCTAVGSTTNTAGGVPLTLVAPVAGVASTATVAAAGLGGGADLETDDSLRSRLLLRIQQPPMGGSASDYLQWALAVPGVTRAWVYPGWQGQGTIGVTFMMDGRANPIPLAADVAVVQAAIDAVRPVAAPTFVFAPTPVPQNFTIHLAPDSLAIRAAVQAQLQALLATAAIPNGTLPISHIWQAIGAAAGEVDFTLTAPAANVATGAGQILTFGGITWA